MGLSRVFVFLVSLVSARLWGASVSPISLGACEPGGSAKPSHSAVSSIAESMMRMAHGKGDLFDGPDMEGGERPSSADGGDSADSDGPSEGIDVRGTVANFVETVKDAVQQAMGRAVTGLEEGVAISGGVITDQGKVNKEVAAALEKHMHDLLEASHELVRGVGDYGNTVKHKALQVTSLLLKGSGREPGKVDE